MYLSHNWYFGNRITSLSGRCEGSSWKMELKDNFKSIHGSCIILLSYEFFEDPLDTYEFHFKLDMKTTLNFSLAMMLLVCCCAFSLARNFE